MAARASADLNLFPCGAASEPSSRHARFGDVRVLLTVLTLLIAAPAVATSDDLRSVAGMQFHNRVLLVFAPRLGDPRLTAQREALARIGLQAAERDLVLVQVDGARVIGAHDKADRLRRRFRVAPDAFTVLLIGKDGRPAITSAAPIDAARIVRTIDAMPMRRVEVERARNGVAGEP
jgi:hypothetical protein